MKTIAFVNGYKMMLPHYGKLDSLYGMFTTEGFIIAQENTQDIKVWSYPYEMTVLVPDEFADKFYEGLKNEEW